jgi:hypothetical protein
MGWIPYSSEYCQVHEGSYCYVSLCQALRTNTTRGPKRAMLIHSWKAMGTLDQGPRSLSWVNGRGEKGRQRVKFCPLALNHRVEN